MNRTAELCVDIRHRRGEDEYCQRLALDGLYLCHGHKREMGRLIAEMPARYDDLDRALTPSGGGRGGGAPGLFIDEAAADLRSDMAGLLASWCAVVVDERGVTPPASEEIWRTAPWLTIHIDWCAAQEFAGDMLAELRAVTGRSYGIADIRPRRLPLDEQCLTHTDGARCTGTVTIVVRGDDWTARCPECGTTQDATPYLRLARRGQWITAADVIHLAALFDIPCSVDVIYQWKRRRRIIGRRGLVENEYELRSVQRYLVRRQAEQNRVA